MDAADLSLVGGCGASTGVGLQSSWSMAGASTWDLWLCSTTMMWLVRNSELSALHLDQRPRQSTTNSWLSATEIHCFTILGLEVENPGVGRVQSFQGCEEEPGQASPQLLVTPGDCGCSIVYTCISPSLCLYLGFSHNSLWLHLNLQLQQPTSKQSHTLTYGELGLQHQSFCRDTFESTMTRSSHNIHLSVWHWKIFFRTESGGDTRMSLQSLSLPLSLCLSLSPALSLNYLGRLLNYISYSFTEEPICSTSSRLCD
jgi:hypothetical protein